MVAIHPDNTRAAARHLEARALIAADLDRNLRAAATLSDLDTSDALAACAEIDEELRLLATVLVARANEAEGFRLAGWDHELTLTLLGSLFDDAGAAPPMTGPLALAILMATAADATTEGQNPTPTEDEFDRLVFTVADLEDIANNPNSSPDLAAAATFLVTHPHILELTRAWEGTGAHLPSHSPGEFPLRDVEAFLARNTLLRQLVGADGIVQADDLYSRVTDAQLLSAGVDPELFASLAMPLTGHDLLVAAIDHGTFNATPTMAREFIWTLPVHYLDGHSIDITATDEGAIVRLYEAATSDLGTNLEDFTARMLLTSFLPETTTGIRNDWITSNYAEVANWHNIQLNGSTPADDPNFRGNNWFHLGVAASYSVSPVIEGDLRSLQEGIFPGFSTPPAVDQDVADGNQAIYHHFTHGQAAAWASESSGSPRLDQAQELLAEAAGTTDVDAAQLLVAQSTMLFAIEEQILVDPYLQLDGLSIAEEAGTYLATGIPAALVSFVSAGFVSPTPRSADQVLTDEGRLEIQASGVDLIDPIPISGPVPTPDHENNTIDPAELAALLPDEFDWSLTEADEWADLSQRLPIIEDVTIATLTEPALAVMVEDQRNHQLADQPRR